MARRRGTQSEPMDEPEGKDDLMARIRGKRKKIRGLWGRKKGARRRGGRG